MRGLFSLGVVVLVVATGCGSDGKSGDDGTSAAGGTGGAGGSGATAGSGGNGAGGSSGSGGLPPKPACAPAPGGGSATVSEPTLLLPLADRWEEGWLGSPAIADLDLDGDREIIVPRGSALLVFDSDGSLVWKFEGATGRIWASAIVADFAGTAELEIAIAARDSVYLLDRHGVVVPGFPVTWDDEMRSLAAGDVDGDGRLEIVAATGHSSPADVMNAWNEDGTQVAGFPPLGSGVSGCDVDQKCYLAGCYDQNLAVGDLDGDGKHDVVALHDNAYASIHRGDGVAFDAEPGFAALKTPGVRYLHDLSLARQGWADNEETALQAHFTNTPPAIADLDGDGTPEVVMLGSAQNASQTDRERGVALWVVGHDVSRPTAWETPHYVPEFLSGLWDYGDNIVAITNQVSVADIDASHAGPELVFAGFDGRIHAVSAAHGALWSTLYTTDAGVATGGVVIGDLSGDGVPEIVFATYATSDGKGALFVLDAAGHELHRLPLPRRGAMPVPTLGDVDGDGTVEIVVSLKDAVDGVESVRVYSVSGSAENCLLWPTGRGNLLRNAWVR